MFTEWFKRERLLGMAALGAFGSENPGRSKRIVCLEARFTWHLGR